MKRIFTKNVYMHDLVLDMIYWWYSYFLNFVINVTGRILRYLWLYLGLKLVVSRFFTPWKNVDNIAGWFVGLTFKILYIIIALPIFCVFALVGGLVIFAEFLYIPFITLLLIL